MVYFCNIQQLLSFSFRIKKSTLSHTLKEMRNSIFVDYLTVVIATKKGMIKIATGFHITWSLPHVTGTIDGNHIRVQSQKISQFLL